MQNLFLSSTYKNLSYTEHNTIMVVNNYLLHFNSQLLSIRSLMNWSLLHCLNFTLTLFQKTWMINYCGKLSAMLNLTIVHWYKIYTLTLSARNRARVSFAKNRSYPWKVCLCVTSKVLIYHWYNLRAFKKKLNFLCESQHDN